MFIISVRVASGRPSILVRLERDSNAGIVSTTVEIAVINATMALYIVNITIIVTPAGFFLSEIKTIDAYFC